MGESILSDDKSRFLVNDPKYPNSAENIDWLLRRDPADHPHPFLLDISRAIGAIIVISLLFHLAKNL